MPGLERKLQVFSHRVVRIQGVVLEHECYVTLRRAPLPHVRAFDQDRARVRRVEARDQSQGRGLAGAGGSQQDKEFAVADVQTEVVERRVAAELLVDVAQLDVGHVCSQPDPQRFTGAVVEEVGLLFVQASPYHVPRLLHVAAGGA